MALLPSRASLLCPPTPRSSVCLSRDLCLSVAPCPGLGFVALTLHLCTHTVTPLSVAIVSASESLAVFLTHMPCLSPARLTPLPWVPITGSWVFLVVVAVYPKSKRNFQPLLPALLQGMLCPRPARMVPSITHGLILALPRPAGVSRRLPGQELQSPVGHLPGALPSCQPALGDPALGIVLCVSQAPGREGKREAAGEGERGRKRRGLHL